MLNILVAGLQTLPAAALAGADAAHGLHLARIKRRIDERLADPALSVSSLAAQLGMSASHIHRVFRASR